MNCIQLENIPCPLGCAKSDEIVLKGHDRLHSLPGEFTVVKCKDCGLMRTNPRPTLGSISFYYPDNYGPYLGTKVEPPQGNKTSVIKKRLRLLKRKIFNSKANALPYLPPGRLLEVGCASGSFLRRMASLGWEVEGIEFSEKAAQAATNLGYHVHVGPLENAPEPALPFDLIIGWMVLEHLFNPVAGLIKLHEWAKPNAYLVISVPNAGSWEFQIFKDKWYALHLPNHLYHFTPQTLTKVLAMGGWTLEKIHHQRSVNNLIVSTAYVAESKGWPRLGQWLRDFAGCSRICSCLLFPMALTLSAFGQTGRMTVWARKKESFYQP